MGSGLKWYEFRKLTQNEDQYGNCFYSHDVWYRVEDDKWNEKRTNQNILFRFFTETNSNVYDNRIFSFPHNYEMVNWLPWKIKWGSFDNKLCALDVSWLQSWSQAQYFRNSWTWEERRFYVEFNQLNLYISNGLQPYFQA